MNKHWCPIFVGLLSISLLACPAVVTANDFASPPESDQSEPFELAPAREVERLFKLTSERGVVNDSDEDPAEFSSDWETVEASLTSARSSAAADSLDKTLSGSSADGIIDPNRSETVENSVSLVPRYLLTAAVLFGLLVGARLGLWRFISRSLFASVAHRREPKVKLRRRHTSPTEMGQDSEYETTSGTRHPRRRPQRRNSHSAPSRPVYPECQSDNETREYILSDVIITTNESVKESDEREQFLLTIED